MHFAFIVQLKNSEVSTLELQTCAYKVHFMVYSLPAGLQSIRLRSTIATESFLKLFYFGTGNEDSDSGIIIRIIRNILRRFPTEK